MTFPAIETLLPHRGSMLWLDEVIARTDDSVRCRLTVRADHVFVEDGSVEPLVAIEWMAQAVAALVGLLDRDNDLDPRPGYLIAIPDAHFHVSRFNVRDVIEVEASRIWGDEQLASFECTVERDGTLCATAQVSVYRRALIGSTEQ